MPTNDPPTDVASLIAKATTSVTNINLHRAAMADVAAKAAANHSGQPKEVKPT